MAHVKGRAVRDLKRRPEMRRERELPAYHPVSCILPLKSNWVDFISS